MPNQEEQEGSGLVVKGRKEKEEGKKSLGLSKACHFYHMKGHWENDSKHRQEWLKKKGQAAEVDVALSGVEDTEVLMASYVKDNTSQDKGWIFDSGNTIHVYSPKKIC